MGTWGLNLLISDMRGALGFVSVGICVCNVYVVSVMRRRSFFFQRFDSALRIAQGFGQESVLLLQESDVPALSDDDII